MATQHLPNNKYKTIYFIFRRSRRIIRLSTHLPTSKSDNSEQRLRQTNIQLDRRRAFMLQQGAERSELWEMFSGTPVKHPPLCSTANWKFSNIKTTLKAAHRQKESDATTPVCWNATQKHHNYHFPPLIWTLTKNKHA